MNKFKTAEPLLSFGPPYATAWARVATNEAKLAGTFVHLGYPPHEVVLTYESAKELRDWLNEVLA